jgi:hypothetical protein
MTTAQNSDAVASTKLVELSQLTDSNQEGAICVRVSSVSERLVSHSGWEYRRMKIEDKSMLAEALVSEEKFKEWKFEKGDYLVCSVKSNGVGKDGRFSVYFNDFLDPFETSRILYELNEKLAEARSRSAEQMKSTETVYQISAREARSLMELIKLWIVERKPQHYTKWCQMHQIVATNLFYMGLVKRTASMSGYYYPTDEAIDFFEGKKNIPKKRVFVRDKQGRHSLASEEGESRSFSDYLSDRADRESSLLEYRDALKAYKDRVGASKN